jgi:Mg-chelatase subunit ChlD
MSVQQYKTSLANGSPRTTRSRSKIERRPFPWLKFICVVWGILSVLGSIAWAMWIARYQSAVAQYVKAPNEQTHAVAHSFEGYPTPTFRQPLLDAADTWYGKREIDTSEIDRIKLLWNEKTANKDRLIEAFVEKQLYAIDHNHDAKHELLSEALAIVESDSAAVKRWEGYIKEQPVSSAVPSDMIVKKLAINPDANTHLVGCYQADTPIEGLTADDFQVIDGTGRLWPHFSVSEVRRSITDSSVIVLIDRSLSMEGARMEQLKAGLMKLVDVVTSKTNMQLVAFDHKVKSLTSFTNDKNVLQSAIRELKPEGATEIAMAIDVALSELKQRTSPRTLILCTDGQDEKLRAGLSAITERCRAINVAVDVLAIEDKSLDRETLTELANSTEGFITYATEPSQIVSKLETLTNGQAHFYRVKIFPGIHSFDSFSIRIRQPLEIARLVAD